MFRILRKPGGQHHGRFGRREHAFDRLGQRQRDVFEIGPRDILGPLALFPDIQPLTRCQRQAGRRCDQQYAVMAKSGGFEHRAKGAPTGGSACAPLTAGATHTNPV